MTETDVSRKVTEHILTFLFQVANVTFTRGLWNGSIWNRSVSVGIGFPFT